MKCVKGCGNDAGYPNLQCDKCLGTIRRKVAEPGRAENDAANAAVRDYFCPYCRARPGRACTIGVGKWARAKWVHKDRRELSYACMPGTAKAIEALFEIADATGASSDYDKACDMLLAALAGKLR